MASTHRCLVDRVPLLLESFALYKEYQASLLELPHARERLVRRGEQLKLGRKAISPRLDFINEIPTPFNCRNVALIDRATEQRSCRLSSSCLEHPPSMRTSPSNEGPGSFLSFLSFLSFSLTMALPSAKHSRRRPQNIDMARV